MNKIKVVSTALREMRNEEVRGFHYEVLKFAKKISAEHVKGLVSLYEKKFQEYNEALKIGVNETSKTVEFDVSRTSAYHSCNRMAEALRGYPGEDANIANVASCVYEIFSKSPSISRLNQIQSTGVINGVLESCNALNGELLETIGFKMYLDKLKEENEKFVEAAMQRDNAKGSHENEKNKRIRNELELCFDSVCSGAEGLGNCGDESCLAFVKSVNGVIETRKASMAQRQTAKKNAKENAKEKETAENANSAAAV